MSTPEEMARAVNEMGRAVAELRTYVMRSGETVRVPRDKIAELYGWLRHYPMPSEVARAFGGEVTAEVQFLRKENAEIRKRMGECDE